MRVSRLVRGAVVIGAVIAGGVDCASSGGGGGGGTGPPGGATLTIATGNNNRVAMVGSAMQVQVELTGASSIQNQAITWSVLLGGGSAPASSQTSNTGVATVSWTMGPAGNQWLKAEYTEPGSQTALSVVVKAAAVANPACFPGVIVDGMTISPSETWTPQNGAIVVPNGANTPTNGVITIIGGTVVCLGPGMSIVLENGGRLDAIGSAGSPVIFTAMDIAQPWGSLRFDDAPAGPSTLTYAVLEYGSLGAIGLTDAHVMNIAYTTINHMTGLGVRLIAAGSSFTYGTISDVQGQPGALGARLGSATGGAVEFYSRATGTPGISVEGPNVTMVDCEITGNSAGIYVQAGAVPLYISGCNLFGNGPVVEFGVHNDQSNGSVAAAGNWWGDPSGPALGANTGSVDASNPLGAPAALSY